MLTRPLGFCARIRACVIRDLSKNAFAGPILPSVTALTRLAWLCAPILLVRLIQCTECAQCYRVLNANGFTGTVPSTISMLTRLPGLGQGLPLANHVTTLPHLFTMSQDVPRTIRIDVF
jgi:hypothetical protein